MYSFFVASKGSAFFDYDMTTPLTTKGKLTEERTELSQRRRDVLEPRPFIQVGKILRVRHKNEYGNGRLGLD